MLCSWTKTLCASFGINWLAPSRIYRWIDFLSYFIENSPLRDCLSIQIRITNTSNLILARTFASIEPRDWSNIASGHLELFCSHALGLIWSTSSLHYLRSRATEQKFQFVQAFLCEHFPRLYSRQYHISLDGAAFVAEMCNNCWRMYCNWHVVELLPLPECRQTSITIGLHFGTGQYFNVRQPAPWNRLQSHDSRTHLGWIYGKHSLLRNLYFHVLL